MTCDSHTNLIPELQFFMIPIPIPIPLELIPILIPIPGFTKINDSDSNSDSSSNWFRFWFRFQCVPKRLILILIPIPASFDSDSNSDSNKPGFDSDSDSGIWFRFRNHLQLWVKCNGWQKSPTAETILLYCVVTYLPNLPAKWVSTHILGIFCHSTLIFFTFSVPNFLIIYLIFRHWNIPKALKSLKMMIKSEIPMV